MWRKGVVVFLAILVLALAGCQSSPKKGNKGHKKPRSAKTTAVASAAAPAGAATLAEPAPAEVHPPVSAAAPAPVVIGSGARVVVDTSGSMKGFVQKGRVTLQTIHRAIDELLSSQGLNSPLERCLLGKELDCTKALAYTEFQNTKIYDAEVSRLDLALVRPTKAPDENPAAPVPQDNLDPFRISIIITDGMQAAQGTAGAIVSDTPTASAVACAAGADPSCLGALLLEREREGYGIWVISLSLPFEGQHYAERGLDGGHWQQVNAHIDELKKAPEWYGVPLEVSKMATNKKTGTSSYQYRGVKPLLFLVLSRDIPAARTFVGGLTNRLRAERIGAPEDRAVQWAELAPLGKRRYSIARVEFADPKKSAGLRLSSLQRRGDGSLVSVGCPSSRDGKPTALLAISLGSEDEAPGLPAYVDQAIALVPGSRSVSDKILKNPKERSAGHYVARVDCTFASAGQHQADFKLLLKQKMIDAVPDSEWWVGLSADNTYEQPERVYGLKPLMLRLLRDALADERQEDALTVQIEKKP